MTTANVQLIVDEVRARDELRNRIQAVRTKCSGCSFDLVARDQTFGGDGLRVECALLSR